MRNAIDYLYAVIVWGVVLFAVAAASLFLLSKPWDVAAAKCPCSCHCPDCGWDHKAPAMPKVEANPIEPVEKGGRLLRRLRHPLKPQPRPQPKTL